MSEDVALPRAWHVAFFAGLFATIALVGVAMWRERDRPLEVEQRVLPALGTVERCEQCHDAADHPGTWMDSHPVERFGCTVCHGGQGLAVTEQAAHEAAPDWERPLYTPTEREAACGGCHEERSLAGAPTLSRGRALVAELGCAGCHVIPGFTLPDRAPDLDGLAQKTSPAWARAWLADPASLNADHRMPAFSLTEAERDALVAFLWSAPGPELSPLPEGGDADRGHLAVAHRRCATCHRIDGRGGGEAPDLSFAGAKLAPAWIYDLLVDTHRLRPHTRMPGFQLPSGEAADIVVNAAAQWIPDTAEPPWAARSAAVDASLVEQGRALFAERGCAGCHRIGAEPRNPSAMSLDGFGRRRVTDLPHGTSAQPADLPAWIATKVQTPTAFDLAGAKPSSMPAWADLSPEDALAIGVAISAARGDAVPGALVVHQPAPTIPAPAGAVGALVDRYRCLVCHGLGGQGGTLAGVALDGEGSRVRRDWLVGFLSEPVTLRMNQSARMPVLGISASEADLLASWISTSLADPRIPEGVQVGDAARGETLYAQRGCASCHVIAGQGTMEGPTLDGAGARLRPAYVIALLGVGGDVVPGGRHGALRLPEDEARDIAAWILSR